MRSRLLCDPVNKSFNSRLVLRNRSQSIGRHDACNVAGQMERTDFEQYSPAEIGSGTFRVIVQKDNMRLENVADTVVRSKFSDWI